MAQAGMSFREILASLTTAPARRFDRSHIAGALVPGGPADLVVLNEDPEGFGILRRIRLSLRAAGSFTRSLKRKVPLERDRRQTKLLSEPR